MALDSPGLTFSSAHFSRLRGRHLSSWIFAEALLGLLGERFLVVTDIFRIFVLI